MRAVERLCSGTASCVKWLQYRDGLWCWRDDLLQPARRQVAEGSASNLMSEHLDAGCVGGHKTCASITECDLSCCGIQMIVVVEGTGAVPDRHLVPRVVVSSAGHQTNVGAPHHDRRPGQAIHLARLPPAGPNVLRPRIHRVSHEQCIHRHGGYSRRTVVTARRKSAAQPVLRVARTGLVGGWPRPPPEATPCLG